MTENEKIRHEGEVIFWNGVLGFIKFQNTTDNIFFHINSTEKKYKIVSLLDKVTFTVGEAKLGRHLGKPMALNIRFSAKGSLSEHKRTIGVLRDWNGRFGFLNSPQMDKEVFLFHSRLINNDKEIQNGDYFTFSPVKSAKNPDQLFAFFAYLLENEKDIDFLKQQQTTNSIDQVKEIISNLIRLQADKPVVVRFELELEELLSNNKHSLYTSLNLLIKQYREGFNFEPPFEILKKHLQEKYLIQLWENEVIKMYDIDIMTMYFHNSSADTKRVIINRFPEEDKSKILRSHFNLLLEKGKIDKSNNDIKTFLDIIYKNKNTRHLEIYKEVEKYVIDTFSAKETVSLWLNDYIEDLPERYIIENFDINNVISLKRDSEKYNRIVIKIYENYLLSFAKEKNFDTDYPNLVQYLSRLREHSKTEFEKIAKATIAPLNKHQKFILGIFEPHLPFDAKEYFEHHWEELNVYFILKYLIGKNCDEPKELIKDKINSITEDKLISFACFFGWNDLISPIKNEMQPSKEEYIPSFLEDVSRFIEKFDRTDIKLHNIGEAIYKSIPYYKVHHLRLWLFGYVNESEYSYIGYRECFKELSLTEQKVFRKRGDNQIKEEIYEGELLEVEPCENIFSVEGDEVTYKAFAENIYFRDGSIMLRKENREYTNIFPETFASSGLNRIPKSSHFNKFEFTIKVQGKDIIETKGFEDFFTQIQTGEIEKALGRIVEPKTSKDNRNKSYVEDWKLRKEVINYLNNEQIEKYSPKIINEPKSRYRRIDKETEIDTFEKTHLYTIMTADGYGIIWENIDMTEDRATFIFKATKETYELQIEKIAHSIVSYGQFRSTLVSARDEDKLRIFKNNHGYIAKILKQRGRNQSFANWEAKLEDALFQSIPNLPDFQEIESLRYWQADMPFSPKINRPPVIKIKDDDIKTVNFDFANPINPVEKGEKPAPPIIKNRKLEILNKLREINQLF